MLGEIIEREVEAPEPPQIPTPTGFPELNILKNKKQSKWKQRLEAKKMPSQKARPEASKPMSESEKIHQENLDKISQMTEDEIDEERKELLSGLDPKLVESLLKRTKRIDTHKQDCCGSDNHEGHKHAEGYNGWIGGGKTDGKWSDVSFLDKDDVDKALGINNSKLEDDLKDEVELELNHKRDSESKTVRFDDVATVKYEDLDENVELDPQGWEDVEDVNDLILDNTEEIAHEDYQLVNDSNEDLSVHFPKPINALSDNEELDLYDPQFYDKLHDKYYPDLPKETHKLSWMTEPLPKQVTTTYESISDMRFDFKGNLIDLTPSDETNPESEIPTYLGLHHHSENPHLPGYTLSELVHLSRSVLPGQRCLSIQILGRILHKLGLHKYNILPVSEQEGNEEFNQSLHELMDNFESLMWDLIEELRIIETLTEAADESKTKNLSVRNYAIEALWLWKQGGGKKKVDDLVASTIVQND